MKFVAAVILGFLKNAAESPNFSLVVSDCFLLSGLKVTPAVIPGVIFLKYQLFEKRKLVLSKFVWGCFSALLIVKFARVEKAKQYSGD